MKHTGTALIVDDDRISRLVLRHILGQIGWESVECGNVSSAHEYLAQEHPDVVICDLQLPDGNGLDVLEYLREHQPDTPYILLSGVTARSQADDPRVAGVSTYLTKPVSTSELAKTLASV